VIYGRSRLRAERMGDDAEQPAGCDPQHRRTPREQRSTCRPSCRAYGAGPSRDGESHRIRGRSITLQRDS
jgi:hypothetical protein